MEASQETWRDMVRQQQEEGVSPASFGTVDESVIMLHGGYDSHPGRMIRANLEPYLPQLEYRERKRCRHYPWLAEVGDNEPFTVMCRWLGRQFTRGPRAAMI